VWQQEAENPLEHALRQTREFCRPCLWMNPDAACLAVLCNLVKTVVQDSFDKRWKLGRLTSKEALETVDNLL